MEVAVRKRLERVCHIRGRNLLGVGVLYHSVDKTLGYLPWAGILGLLLLSEV